jgi:hypothetical protein
MHIIEITTQTARRYTRSCRLSVLSSKNPIEQKQDEIQVYKQNLTKCRWNVRQKLSMEDKHDFWLICLTTAGHDMIVYANKFYHQ